MMAKAGTPSTSLPGADEATVVTTLAHATNELRACTDVPRLEAELLLAHTLDLSRSDLYAYPERLLALRQQSSFQKLLARRAGGEPLPYLTGHIEFYGLDLAVDPRVLIPRQDTETLVELALGLADRGRRTADDGPRTPDDGFTIADVGTGSGCIAVALSVHLPEARLYALDLSSDALAVARTNAERHGVAERISFIQSDLLAALPAPVDLIVANPPYVSTGEWPALPREVGGHEPRLALYGGSDGLDVIRQLLDQAPGNLRPGGDLLTEIGAAQGEAVIQLAHRAFPDARITLHPDLSGYDRVVCLRTQLSDARGKE